MGQITLKVDFNQLLEDVAYTNAVSKSFDVNHIVTRNQYYDNVLIPGSTTHD